MPSPSPVGMLEDDLDDAGSARNSGQVQDLEVALAWRMLKVHSGSGLCGAGPADSTGKSPVTCWSGGSFPPSAASGGLRR